MKTLLTQQIYERYYQVANSDLGLDTDVANTIGTILSEYNSVFVGFSQFCMTPTARSPQINSAILKRWLTAAPAYLILSNIFSKSKIKGESIKYFNSEASDILFDATFEIGINYFKLSKSSSNDLANCITKSASASFAFYQRSNSPESYTLRKHTKLLRNFTEEALPFIISANALINNPSYDRHG